MLVKFGLWTSQLNGGSQATPSFTFSNFDNGVNLYDIFSPPQFGECTRIGETQFIYDMGFDDIPYHGNRGNRKPWIAMHLQPNQTLLKKDFLNKIKNMFMPTIKAELLHPFICQRRLINENVGYWKN